MLKAIMATVVMMVGTAASAEIVFQQSGDDARNLETSGLIFEPTSYRATFDAPGFDPDDFILFVFGLAETFLYFDGQIIDQNNSPFYIDVDAARDGSAFVGSFTVPEFVDERDEDGNGFVYQNFYQGRPMSVSVETVGGQSVPWTYTVETIAAVPEPATWSAMISGFAIAGAAARRRQVGMSG